MKHYTSDEAPDDEPGIPISQQVAMFEHRWVKVVEKLAGDLESRTYRYQLHDLALRRLVGGYPLYGDSMYAWGDSCRRANMDEELADYIVYGTSSSPDP